MAAELTGSACLSRVGAIVEATSKLEKSHNKWEASKQTAEDLKRPRGNGGSELLRASASVRGQGCRLLWKSYRLTTSVIAM